MYRVVFDTVIFVRSLINPRSFAGKIVFGRASRYNLVLSAPVVEEILEVLQRPELTRKFRTLQNMDLREVLAILARAELVEVGPVFAVSRDPKDDKFLATAKAAGASYLVSADDDLLVLAEYEGIRIVDAAAFLRILEEEPDRSV